jgi:hypothetical protein
MLRGGKIEKVVSIAIQAILTKMLIEPIFIICISVLFGENDIKILKGKI